MTGAPVPVVPLAPPPPVVLAYGIGVDSTALLIEKHARGEAPDLVLTADTSVEKPATQYYNEAITLAPDSESARSASELLKEFEKAESQP